MASVSFGGLASGLNTTDIITQLMALEKRPRILLDNKQVLIEERQSILKDFQSKLRTLQLAATDLRSVTLFQQKQAVESSDATKVSVSSNSGAGVGGYQVEVQQLANAAQRTFAYTVPAAGDSITIEGHATAITAGMTAQEFATAINTDRDARVYAAAIDERTIVFSRRETGFDDDLTFIDYSGGASALTEDRAKERAGRDALYTVDGVARRSATNVIRDAVAGVTLTLRGVTTASGPITVSVGAPGADTEAITRKLQAFVDAYNAAVNAIRGKLNERSVPDSRTKEEIANGVADTRTVTQKKAGTLFGDRQLNMLLSTMRQSIYSPVAGAPAGFDSLTALGISTGAVSSSTSRDTLNGVLTLDTDRLSRALASDPNAVRDLLAGVSGTGGFARSFERLIDESAGLTGILSTRITGADDEMRVLRRQMEQMDARLALKEKGLQRQFTALEVAMQKSQAQGNWLTGQLAGLG
ncbi:flagellar filament capping protein FliD [Conexibacter stalactiti]|uniref:Flagellar hook-associated protein 2 n=1 Tax=Conexibacter stalactiti TaxID=1940611 RepID=A0ABU4HUM8_9ACTN|nr:flagellar filament capping protein FliD [Conexibacter stalactiti]MDW5597018.1 flagellar filament capping protein FliD [Conexibacter stalactiti]MEC5037660.1 flagellar filament capping protein FliD [Conexibacter stalactiti]